MSALFVIALALYFVFAGTEDPWAAPPLFVPVAQVAVGIAVHVLIETIGYRTAALAPSLSEEDSASAGRKAWQSSMVLRFALSESVAIASVAAAFVVPEGGYLTYLGGLLVSVARMAIHVWPSARPVGRLADALERDGRSSHLRETFGVAAPGPGQRL